MKALCGTCAAVVDPQNSDEGYSHCCNDRIVYGLEAAELIAEEIQETKNNIAFFTEKGEESNAAWHTRRLARLTAVQEEGF
jgi:hypothetical protein